MSGLRECRAGGLFLFATEGTESAEKKNNLLTSVLSVSSVAKLILEGRPGKLKKWFNPGNKLADIPQSIQ